MKYLVATLTLALALCGYGLYAEIQAGAVKSERITSLTEAADRAAARAKSDRKVLVAREAEIASKARKLAQAQEALSEALQRNNDWSNTNVPTDVQKALLGDSGASDPVSDTGRMSDYREIDP